MFHLLLGFPSTRLLLWFVLVCGVDKNMADDNLTTEEIVTTITRTTSTPVETKTIESSTTTGTFAYLYWTGGSDPPSVDADDKDQTTISDKDEVESRLADDGRFAACEEMAELTLTSGAWMTCVWPTDGDTNILYNYGGEIIPPTTIWSETTTVETTTSFDTHALSEKEEESTDSTTEPEQDEESTQDSESESDDDSSSSSKESTDDETQPSKGETQEDNEPSGGVLRVTSTQWEDAPQDAASLSEEYQDGSAQKGSSYCLRIIILGVWMHFAF